MILGAISPGEIQGWNNLKIVDSREIVRHLKKQPKHDYYQCFGNLIFYPHIAEIRHAESQSIHLFI